MREIEAKVLEVDGKALRRKLRELGAKKKFSRTQHSIYFDFPDKRLYRKETVFRIRSEGNKNVLCIKSKPRGRSVKSLEELEITVSDFNQTVKLIKALGLREILNIKKHRVSFTLQGAEIDIEKIGGIPTYIEIEASSEKKVETTAKRLGFSKKQLLPWNVFQVLEHYKKKP